MNQIVEIDDRGAIQLPKDVLGAVEPHTRFVLEIKGTTLILHPEAEQPFWATASPSERAEAVRLWAGLERPLAPILSNEALHRENLYD